MLKLSIFQKSHLNHDFNHNISRKKQDSPPISQNQFKLQPANKKKAEF
jgi:hypothetical protein